MQKSERKGTAIAEKAKLQWNSFPHLSYRIKARICEKKAISIVEKAFAAKGVNWKIPSTTEKTVEIYFGQRTIVRAGAGVVM